MTKHMTGDSEVKRDLRKMKTAPQALTARTMTDFMRDEPSAPAVVDRGTFQAELDALRIREKAHTRKGDAIAAARRRLGQARDLAQRGRDRRLAGVKAHGIEPLPPGTARLEIDRHQPQPLRDGEAELDQALALPGLGTGLVDLEYL